MNPFSKTLYESAGGASVSHMEQIALLFERSARHILKARQAITENKYETRFQETDRAISLLVSLSTVFDRDSKDPGVNNLIAELDVFTQDIFRLIMKLNLDDDAELCTTADSALRQMANVWRVKAKESVKEEQSVQPNSPPAPAKMEASSFSELAAELKNMSV